MTKLDIAERRLLQDGRIDLSVRGNHVDFRVSTMPSSHGEKVVLRILDRQMVVFDLVKLVLPAPVIAKWNEALAQPNGVIFVAEPTGSGKMTTLYTGLSSLTSTKQNLYQPPERLTRDSTQSADFAIL